jgi:hypothetical protein
MPGTKRTPINRPPTGGRITDEAIALFDAMQRINCVCPPIDWGGEFWKRRECVGCQRWWELHSQLHDALNLKPWNWPVYQHPDSNPYPSWHAQHGKWAIAEAQERWRALDAASRWQRRKKRVSQHLPAPAK